MNNSGKSLSSQSELFLRRNAADINARWDEPWRAYHNLRHMYLMTDYIGSRLPSVKDDKDFPVFMGCFDIAARMHDIVCEPGADDNEEKSVELFLEWARGKLSRPFRDMVVRLVNATRSTLDRLAGDPLASLFVKADWNGMMDWKTLDRGRMAFLDYWEEGIFKEYQKYPLKAYAEGRMKFLNNAYDNGMITSAVVDYVHRRIESKVYRVGVYAGSFAPFHTGHLDILGKAMRMFDKVVVACGVNPEKPQRESNIKDVLKHVETGSYDGLLADYLVSVAMHTGVRVQVTLIRGIRNGWDLQQEFNLISFVKERYERVMGRGTFDVALIPCDPSLAHVSSTAVRSLPPMEQLPYLPPHTI